VIKKSAPGQAPVSDSAQPVLSAVAVACTMPQGLGNLPTVQVSLAALNSR
jgi:hypothetical protein